MWIGINGVWGRYFGYTGNSIFLPAAGFRNANNGILNYGGSFNTYGYCRSRDSDSSSMGYRLGFYETYVLPLNVSNYNAGYSVRCVATS
jgi:hypothetical protein